MQHTGEIAFSSVIHIIRDVNYGLLLRTISTKFHHLLREK
jgi:quinol-cytochrome oxidoreductase complex cytochrome b subunit